MLIVLNDKFGIVGSVNVFVRNLGMVCGIVLVIIFLYSMMSFKIGYCVIDYVVGRNDVFIYGMKIVYIVVVIISLVGVVLIFFRLNNKKINESK